jgi:hypothetical protein
MISESETVSGEGQRIHEHSSTAVRDGVTRTGANSRSYADVSPIEGSSFRGFFARDERISSSFRSHLFLLREISTWWSEVQCCD